MHRRSQSHNGTSIRSPATKTTAPVGRIDPDVQRRYGTATPKGLPAICFHAFDSQPHHRYCISEKKKETVFFFQQFVCFLSAPQSKWQHRNRAYEMPIRSQCRSIHRSMAISSAVGNQLTEGRLTSAVAISNVRREAITSIKAVRGMRSISQHRKLVINFGTENISSLAPFD